MGQKNLDDFCIPLAAKVADALRAVQQNAKGVVLVVDGDRRLLGLLTDGDFRRALLRGVGLSDGIAPLLLDPETGGPRIPVVVNADMGDTERRALLLQKKLRHLPVVKDGRVVDLVFLDEFGADAGAAGFTAMLMAGGFGKRLQPLTFSMPKPMLPVGGRPILERLMRQVSDAGIKDVFVTTHYLPERIVEHFRGGEDFGVSIKYLHEDHPRGTAGALGTMRGQEGPILVVNGDIVTALNFNDLMHFHVDAGADITVGVRPHQVHVPFGVVDLEDQRVVGITEKPTYTYFVAAGMYVVEPKISAAIKLDERIDMPDLIRRVISDGGRVESFPISEYWSDIGRIEDYTAAQSAIFEPLTVR